MDVASRKYAEGERLSPADADLASVLIPQQMDLALFRDNCAHPDPRMRDVFAHGRFPSEDPQLQVILGSWLERHQKAWHMELPVECYGLDVARSLDGDSTVLASGGADGCRELDLWKFDDNMKHVENIFRITKDRHGIDLKIGQVPICIDYGGGYGAGVGDRLAELGVWVIRFGPGDRSMLDPRRYENMRAEGYALLGRMLDPNDLFGHKTWALPPDEQLEAELVAPEKIHSGGDGFRFRLSPKQPTPGREGGHISVKEKIGRSPDKADAVVCLFHAVRELHNLNQWFMQNSGPLTVYPEPPQPTAGSPPQASEPTDLVEYLEQRYGGGRSNSRSTATPAGSVEDRLASKLPGADDLDVEDRPWPDYSRYFSGD